MRPRPGGRCNVCLELGTLTASTIAPANSGDASARPPALSGGHRWVPARPAVQPARRAASPRALMCAIDWIEIWGFTPEAVGNAEPSQT